MLPANKMRSLFGWNTQSGHAPLVKTPAGTAVELDVVVTIARTNRNGQAGDLAKDENLAMNSNGERPFATVPHRRHSIFLQAMARSS